MGWLDSFFRGLFATGPTKSQTKSAPDKLITTAEERSAQVVSRWRENDDVVEGLQFCATMQLRTPLRVLSRHSEMHTDARSDPPVIARETWEGIWVPKVRSFKSMGIDIPEFEGTSTMASDVGQIPQNGGDYLSFLIAVRKVVESSEPIDTRVTRLRALLSRPEHATFVAAHKGADAIVGRFFPTFLQTIPKLPAATVEELRRQRLDTPNRITAASDAMLSAIKGIGPSKLKGIREHCAQAPLAGRDEVRVDRVGR